ncbi:carbon-nitrogen hydrolase family protein (plasmid) [Sinorhizobium sp. K101]|nr:MULTISPECIES: carbon-nitrogen hydrolase family protein [unclassified Sinorhizobium]WEJ08768.1 carbon-nitrogen hydrolase family protein [Sinorhizobium sp. M103]WEJ14143.1 carbon-nitrogen hydrolase family protein [Sinorhizobium sp. K101]WEJ35738.1 carbon-nitrogen hydrolase family protein [Sinorhizobium sp. C101]
MAGVGRLTSIRIALLQLHPGESPRESFEIGAEGCRRAQKLGADICLLPEIWSHGYRFFDPATQGSLEEWRDSSMSWDSEFVRGFRELAKELSIAIGFSFLEASDRGPRNAFALADMRGEIVLKYAKVHVCLHALERNCAPGEDFYVAPLHTRSSPVIVGAMICYDREFPEAARILALKGAEIVLVPNACHLDDHRLGQLKTRAFENKIVLAMTNYPSSAGHGNGRSVGISAIAFSNTDARSSDDNKQSQYREILMVEGGPEEGIFTFDVDLDELRSYRENAIWGGRHRRPDTYQILTERIVEAGPDPHSLIN